MMKFSEEFNLYNEKHEDWFNSHNECWAKVCGKRVSFYKDFGHILEEAQYNGEQVFFAEKVEMPQQLLLMPLERNACLDD